jgi:hypothetical protein
MAGMEEITKDEQGLTLEKARELLGKKEISDEQLLEIVNAVKVFCKIAYELYAKEQEQLKILDENSRAIPLSENTDFKEAA